MAKAWAFAKALLKIYSVFDDLRFIGDPQNDDRLILITFYVCIFFEPVYVIYSVLRLDFEKVYNTQKSVLNILKTIPMEYLGLQVVFVPGKEPLRRLQFKGLVATLSKSGPVTILKLISQFRSGATIGALYVFTLTKSYMLFFLGVGSTLPVISAHFRKSIIFTAVSTKLVTLSIFASVFMVYFQKDRSAQFEEYGFDISPSKQLVDGIFLWESVAIAAVILGGLVAFVIKKCT